MATKIWYLKMYGYGPPYAAVNENGITPICKRSINTGPSGSSLNGRLFQRILYTRSCIMHTTRDRKIDRIRVRTVERRQGGNQL